MAQLLADAVMAPGRNGAYDAVFRWVLLMALIAIAAVVSYDYGLLNYLFGADKSKITVLIAVLYLGFSGHCLWILLELSREYRRALQIKDMLATSAKVPQLPQGGGLIDQAIKDVGKNYDAIVELFESFESFLRRLDIYTKIPSTTAMEGIIIKILIELLSTISLAIQQAKQGRLSERRLLRPGP